MDSAGHGPIGPSNPRAISCLEERANRRRSARPSWWCPPPTQIPPEGVSESWDPPVLGACQFGGAHESSTFCAPLPVVLLCRFPSLPPFSWRRSLGLRWFRTRSLRSTSVGPSTLRVRCGLHGAVRRRLPDGACPTHLCAWGWSSAGSSLELARGRMHPSSRFWLLCLRLRALCSHGSGCPVGV